ncbi:MAG: Ig-like domain-containing protein [Pseudomonadota bacterium]
MSQLKAGILFFVLLCLTACGRQVVEFGDDAGTEAGTAPTVISTKPVRGASGVGLGSVVSATFSTAMAAATIDATTFTVKQGSANVAGVVTLNAATNTATFKPAASLKQSSIYSATISTGATDSAGIALASNYTWSFTTGDGTADEPPTVIATTPPADASDVSPDVDPDATFSEAMDPTTITASTFLVKQGTKPIRGSVKYDAASNTATFSPDAPLDFDLEYTATITTDVQASGGAALAEDYSWAFTTSESVDRAPPTVISTLPADDSTGVPLDAAVSATFSEAMDPATVSKTTFTVKQGTTTIAGTVTLDAATNTATFTPTAPLLANLFYTATINTGAKDVDGLALAMNYTWGFTTAADTAAPTVIAATPVNLAINVPSNVKPTATFSKAMDPATLSATTFTLKQGATTVTGTVSLDALTNTATFTPTAPLLANLVYTATITTGAKDLGGTALAANYTWTFTIAPNTVAPTVTSTTPVNLAINVPSNVKPTATFSKAMDPATLSSTTFTLKQGATTVTGTVSLDALTNTAMFTPAAPLQATLVYTATITTGAKDLGGTALAANYTWTFTIAPNTVAPTVTSTTPVNLAINVPSNVKPTATFSKAMDPATLSATTFTLKQGATSVTGTVSLDALTNTAMFTPAAPLLATLVYTATITTGAKDLGGTALAANYTWSFTIAANAAAPTVTSTTPLNLATGVSINTKPTAAFSTAMDPSTLTPLTFTLKQGLLPVTGSVAFNPLTNTATFTPDNPLLVNLPYSATITSGAKDLGGTPLATDYTWSFTTAACSQAKVVLGAASDFAVLAGSTVTNTGPTIVTGDLGVSPGTAVTGFLPGLVIGTQHAGDPTAAQGIADLTTAYNDAAGRTLCAVTVAGNLGGQTLTPGLYKSTSSLAVSSGDLTLDAQGDGDAIFVFQAASTLTTTSGRLVILANGAKAANIYWQVGTSATLGSTSSFQGTIMADQAITLGTGATLNGRVLARIAAINLDSNTIVKPLP